MSRQRLVYLVGPPGAGKTTLMRNATQGWTAHPSGWASEQRPTRKLGLTLLADRQGVVRAIEVGRRRARFGGTDALAMNISPTACEWIGARPFGLILGEGARLGNQPFLSAAKAAKYAITVVHLDADRATTDERCAERGSEQNESWRAGATTKAANLAAWAATIGAMVIHLDGRGDPDDLARDFAEVIVG